MLMVRPEIKVLPNPQAVAQQAAERIVSAANAVDRFSLALSGGSTPKILFELLASDAYKSRIDWPRVEIFFADERCVPPEHADSNFRMANETLLSKVPIPRENVHRMRGEIEPNEAAKEYGEMLKERFNDDGLDMLLLGMGDDGHTASLFPGTEALKEAKHRCVANFVPKLNTWRITLSAPFINRANKILVLVTGQSKAVRVAEVLEGPRDPGRLPIQLIEPINGTLTWLLDVEAAGMREE
jgi:6-phosphogluconolactonase